MYVIGDFPTISSARALIASRKLSSLELTNLCLDRIASLDRVLHSFVFVNADGALAAARNADRELQNGRYRGPLHGIPYGLKDVFDVAGVVTTAGSRAFRSNVARRNSEVVDRLDAGSREARRYESSNSWSSSSSEPSPA